ASPTAITGIAAVPNSALSPASAPPPVATTTAAFTGGLSSPKDSSGFMIVPDLLVCRRSRRPLRALAVDLLHLPRHLPLAPQVQRHVQPEHQNQKPHQRDRHPHQLPPRRLHKVRRVHMLVPLRTDPRPHVRIHDPTDPRRDLHHLLPQKLRL